MHWVSKLDSVGSPYWELLSHLHCVTAMHIACHSNCSSIGVSIMHWECWVAVLVLLASVCLAAGMFTCIRNFIHIWFLIAAQVSIVLNRYSLESESVPGNAVNVIFDTPEQRQDIWTYVFQLALMKSCTGCGTVSLSQYIDLAKLRDIWSQLTISWEYCCIPVCPRSYLLPLTNWGLPSICCSHQ